MTGATVATRPADMWPDDEIAFGRAVDESRCGRGRIESLRDGHMDRGALMDAGPVFKPLDVAHV